ncbi:hypothetical protein GALMADRAFT_518565 [Galerina marginata CBS 339.88]|uniref:Uncharacterized protein n=1 Tax=Galerina marginata (strain CBS 339.88) TaxID=685588 RepID=A0A067SVP5_GALM3|nr:hypothetical protein GALMADRAFT_518565 [Galerina marginata CBS 339.88]
MIVNSSSNNNMKAPTVGAPTPQDNPPSYDFATESGSPYAQNDGPKPNVLADSKADTKPSLVHHNAAGPSTTVQPMYTSPPTVYSYMNPRTGEHIASLLPPDHPEMICLQAGSHVPHTQYGLLGILAAVFWFPLGIGLCLLDRRVRCTRCGLTIDNGVCG